MVEQVMKPLFQALCLVQYDGPTSGYLYEMMEMVQDAVKQCCNNIKLEIIKPNLPQI